MASAELQKVLGLMAERPLGEGNPTLEDMRAGMEATSFPATDAATVTPVVANGVPGEWVTVAESDPNRRLLYVHGGGYVIGSAVSIVSLRGYRSRRRLPPLNLDLPGRPRASRSKPRRGRASRRAHVPTVNGPNGAGAADVRHSSQAISWGQTDAARCSQARSQGVDQPNAAIGISAWTDPRFWRDYFRPTERTPDYRLRQWSAGWLSQYLSGESAERTRRVAPRPPNYQDWAPLPSSRRRLSSCFPTRPVSAEKARAAGVDVVEEVWDEMFHVWHAFAPMLPEGQAAVDRIGEFINQHA